VLLEERDNLGFGHIVDFDPHYDVRVSAAEDHDASPRSSASEVRLRVRITGATL
jgi:hypothetical protein